MCPHIASIEAQHTIVAPLVFFVFLYFCLFVLLSFHLDFRPVYMAFFLLKKYNKSTPFDLILRRHINNVSSFSPFGCLFVKYFLHMFLPFQCDTKIKGKSSIKQLSNVTIEVFLKTN